MRTYPSTKIALLIILLTSIIGCQEKSTFDERLLGLGTGIHDAIILVDSLEEARAYYRDTLGFDLRKSGKGTFEGTLSSRVSFGDMTALQLMSVNDTLDESAVDPFIFNALNTSQGVILFSLSSSSLDSTVLSLSSHGFQTDSISSYRSSSSEAKGWSRDDGGNQRRSLDFSSSSPPAALPRFVEKIGSNYATMNKEWNSYYVYGRMFSEHPNGVVGISALRIAVKDLQSKADTFKTMGLRQLSKTDTEARFGLYRHQELHLVASVSDPVADQFITSNGEGVFAIRFDVANLDSTRLYFEKELPTEALNITDSMLTIAPDYAYGVQLEFVNEPAEQNLLVRKLTPSKELDTLAVQHATALYTKYCALCHGDNREGYAADNAPSLRSKSLLATSMNNNFMRYAIQFGRGKSAMAGYLDSQGGPLEYIEVEILLNWLNQMAEVEEPIVLSREPVLGDIDLGATLYEQHCAVCHGKEGEGVSAPALANPMLLATATDHFLRYAIAKGRDGTPMVAFENQLDSLEINAITAFLRSRASGWDIPKLDSVRIPTPDEYVLNADNDAPEFVLREDMFVSSEQVNQALEDNKRMIILDARSEVAWRQMHIPGAIPVPYYEEPENFVNDIPNDGTQIVIYCACPHAASKRVLSTLKRNGYENLAIIDEGILIWAQMGYPVRSGS